MPAEDIQVKPIPAVRVAQLTATAASLEPESITPVIRPLPGISQAATIVHRGPMDNVLATIQTLARWIGDHGYRTTAYPRELYLECPDDEDKRVTELQEPVTTA